MQHTNPVFQVLITSGVQTPAVLAKGQRPMALKNGQIGFFNAHTGLSIDATSAAEEIKDYYIMVGINRTSGGSAVAEDVQGSSGYYIQPRHTTSITLKGSQAEVPKAVTVSNFTVLCDTDYCIKLLITNQQSYQINGFNTLTKTFCYHAGCCGIVDCGDCPPAGSPAEVAQGLAALINADPDKLFIATTTSVKILGTFSNATTAGNITVTVGTASYVVAVGIDAQAIVASKIVAAVNATAGSPYVAGTTATPGQVAFYSTVAAATPSGTVGLAPGATGVTLSGQVAAASSPYTDYTTLPAGAGGSLVITATTTQQPTFAGNVPVKYFKGGTTFEVALTSGIGACNGTITTTQEPVFPEGKAVDIKYLEYVAGGWNGKPGVYRTLSLNGGLPKEDFEYFSVAGAPYNVYVISNDIESVSGNFSTYKNPVATYIAVPCGADVTVLNGIAAVLDKIYAGRFEMAADAAALPTGTCNTNPLTSSLPVNASGVTEFVA